MSRWEKYKLYPSDKSVRWHLIWALIWRVCVWAEVLCTCLCEWRVMTGQRCSNDRDSTIYCHNTNQTHPGLVSVLLPLLKKDLFTQGSDYNVPLAHYPQGVSHSVPLFGAYFLSVLSLLKQDRLLRLNSGHTDPSVRMWRCFKLSCTLRHMTLWIWHHSEGAKGKHMSYFNCMIGASWQHSFSLEEMCGLFVVSVLLCCWGTALRNVHKFITSSSWEESLQTTVA